MQFNDATKAFWRYLVGKDIGVNEINDDSSLRMWMELDGISGDVVWPGSVAGGLTSIIGYGIVGDGVADDTTAFNAAMAANIGKDVIANDTYKVTGNVPNLHGPKLVGDGKIVRGATTFYFNPTGSQKNTIYVSPTGNDSNDGITSDLPKATWQAAFDVVDHYGPLLDGYWEIVSAAGTYPNSSLNAVFDTASKNRVVIRGPVVGDSPAVPTAILDGTGGVAYSHGLRVSGIGVKAELRDLKAINMTAGGGDSTRIGFVGEGECNILFTNCHVVGATWCGLYAFNAVRCYAYGGILDGCRSGFVTNYSQCTVSGAAANQVMLIKNCTESGVYWSRGSQGHLDYAVLDSNATGMIVAENSRVDAVGCNFKKNNVGVETRTGGVYGSGGDPIIFNTGTADANTQDTQYNAFSGEVFEVGDAKSWTDIVVDRASHVVTGVAVKTTLATPYTVKAGRMVGTGHAIRVHCWGLMTAMTAGGTFNVDFGGMTCAITLPAAATNLTFEFTAELLEVAGGYKAYCKLSQGLNMTRYGRFTSGFSNVIDQAIVVSVTPANAADSITVEEIVVSTRG